MPAVKNKLSVAAIAKPIRIARIITRFGVGGVERHVSTLTANLDREKFQSWVICGRAGKNERECLDSLQIPALSRFLSAA